MGNGQGGQLRAQKTEASEKQSYLKHTEERRGPIQLALTYRSHPVNGKDGAMGREKGRWGVEEEMGQGSSECNASSQRNQSEKVIPNGPADERCRHAGADAVSTLRPGYPACVILIAPNIKIEIFFQEKNRSSFFVPWFFLLGCKNDNNYSLHKIAAEKYETRMICNQSVCQRLK